MGIFFFIPFSVIFIILFFVIGFGSIGIELLAQNILKWQYPIFAVMLIVPFISDILIVIETNVHMVFKIIYCTLSMFFDVIKQVASMVLIMVFILEIVDDIHKYAISMLLLGPIYLIFLLLIIMAAMFVCSLTNGITSWFLDNIESEVTSFVISLILNVILTMVYFKICMILINADSSQYTKLFGNSIFESILQAVQNTIKLVIH